MENLLRDGRAHRNCRPPSRRTYPAWDIDIHSTAFCTRMRRSRRPKRPDWTEQPHRRPATKASGSSDRARKRFPKCWLQNAPSTYRAATKGRNRRWILRMFEAIIQHFFFHADKFDSHIDKPMHIWRKRNGKFVNSKKQKSELVQTFKLKICKSHSGRLSSEFQGLYLSY